MADGDEPRDRGFIAATGQGWKSTLGWIALLISGAAAVVQFLGPDETTGYAYWVVIVSGSVGVAAEWSIRCPKCRRSVGWWAYSTGTAANARDMLENAPACPRCGFAPTRACNALE